MNERSLAIVFGYLRGIDRPNKTAQKLGLEARFSLALDTYRKEKGFMFFDAPMLAALLQDIFSGHDYDALNLSFYEKEEEHFRDLRTAFARIEKEEENDAFVSMSLLREGRVICYIETGFYTAIGGPAPYHDTLNFALYLAQYDRAQMEQVLTHSCRRHEFRVREVCYGPERPPEGVLTKLKRFLFH